MTHTYLELQEMQQLMKAAQDENNGFPLTIRELVGIFNVHSTSVVSHRLKLMVDAGLVVVKESGKRKSYKAV